MAVTIVFLFTMLGVYSQRLAHRIFEHPKFLEMMRLHSKTILKLNASILAVFVNAAFIVTLNLATFEYARLELGFANVTISNTTKPLGMYLLAQWAEIWEKVQFREVFEVKINVF